MESLPKDVILKFNPDSLENVRKLHGLERPGDMAKAVEIFDTWIKQQEHFVVKDFDKDYLERLIIASKGSVERAKARLDRLCTMRTLMPHYFGDYDVKNDFMNLDDVFAYCPLPKMTLAYERIFFIRYNGQKFDNDIFLNAYRNIAMLVEYFKYHDYADSYVFLIDLREVNMAELVTKLSLLEVRQIMSLITDGYGMRLKGLHMLTSSKLIDTLISLLKQVLSEKLSSRIRVHKSVESFYEIAPREILPKDYGGDEMSLDELRDKWVEVLSSEEYRKLWRAMCAAKTDENRRQTDKFNDQYLGMPGTFRTLSVD